MLSSLEIICLGTIDRISAILRLENPHSSTSVVLEGPEDINSHRQ